MSRFSTGAPMARDLPFEREWTRNAAATLGLGAAELVEFAEIRALDGPVLGLPGRDLAREGLEELADARNYIVWRLSELYQPGNPPADMEVVTGLSGALAHVAGGYAMLNAARLLAAGR